MKFKYTIILTLLSWLWLTGCANTTAFGDVRRDLPEQIGYMIYEEAVQYYGEPDRLIQLPQGGFYAQWLRPGIFIDESLKLTFDSNQIMRAYDYHQHPLGMENDPHSH
ncbi:MAG: hypothetical protein LBJ14_06705 [Desulfarculales bacterium]|jgi:hypothetical protein|nr:hypothetical protein [Desulfarculales bacterium]